MKTLTEYSYNSICNYFKSLQTFGYRTYEDVFKLLVLLYIEELENGCYQSFLTEDDKKTLNSMLYCIYGTSCIFPYPQLNGNSFICK